MKKIILVLISLVSLNLSAAIPTVEGLFRNGSNEDIKTDTVVIRAKLEKKTESPLDFTAVKEDIKNTIVDNNDANANNAPIYLKLIFHYQENRPIALLQVVYNNSQMTEDAIVSVSYFKDLEKMALRDQNVERLLLYSYFTMFGLNESDMISSLLKRLNRDYKTNSEMIDADKKTLLKKYKNYLAAIKEDKSLKDSLNSPLKPEDETDSETVKEVMNRRTYVRPDAVKLERINGKFYWMVTLENFEGQFSNMKNQLLKLRMNTPNGIVRSTVSDYVLFDGSHELPKNIIIKDIIDSVYHLQMLSFNSFDSKNKTISTRYNDYLKLLEKSPSKNAVYSKDYFIY